MAKITIGFAVALILLGVGSYFATGTYSWTALIPAIPGVILLLCGLVAQKPAALKHAMHAAAVVSLLGALAALGALVARWSLMSGVALTANVLMLLLCAGLLAFCVKSFIDARKSRLSG